MGFSIFGVVKISADIGQYSAESKLEGAEERKKSRKQGILREYV